MSRRRLLACAATLLALLAGCRSTGPAVNETPLAPGTPLPLLRTVRSVMRVRITSAERTQSFRAQLLLQPARGRMELNAYTPIGTAAFTLFADGTRVTFLNHLERTAWRGDAAGLAGAIGLLGGAAPVEWALAALGYPSGLEGVTIAYPAADGADGTQALAPVPRVVFTREDAAADITNLGVYSSDAAVSEPRIPRDYRCCVPPGL